MMLICPVHTPEFLTAQGLGVEAHIGRYDREPGWEQYIPFVGGVHLPYRGLNLAAFDDELRNHSIQVVKDAIDEGCRYPVDRMVMHSMGIQYKKGEEVGNYERMIDGIRELAAYAAEKKIILCLENQALHIPDLTRYGTFAEEWIQLQKDVDRTNVLLTLDTSHAACAAATLPTAEERFAYLDAFLKEPDRIGWVHWSDSRLENNEAYFNDMHLIPGEGDLPRAFHQRIKGLDTVKTLEQKRPEADVLKGLAFIESL